MIVLISNFFMKNIIVPILLVTSMVILSGCSLT